MNKQTRTDLYKRAIELWGSVSQYRQLQEECAELIAAINQFDRGRISLDELAEEVADVEIMIEQARLMLSDRAVDLCKERKLHRLEKEVGGHSGSDEYLGEEALCDKEEVTA